MSTEVAVAQFLRSKLKPNGWTDVYLVDEHKCVLHTEPVCSVPTEWFPWFLDWLEEQKCPVRLPGLLYHPGLGETREDIKPSADEEVCVCAEQDGRGWSTCGLACTVHPPTGWCPIPDCHTKTHRDQECMFHSKE